MRIRVTKKAPDAYQHGDLREALIDAGVKLLMEGGADALSLRGAAQLAGVSHAAPYRHYKDKDALIAAIAERGFRLLTAKMRSHLEASGARKADRKLVALGVGYVMFGMEHPAYLQLIFGGFRSRTDMPPELAAAGAQAYSVLRDTVDELLEGFYPAIEDAIGRKAEKRLLPMQDGDVPATYADTALLGDWVAFAPGTPVREGVARFVAWYRDYYRA